MNSGLGLLQNLSEEDLDWVFARGEQLHLAPGDVLMTAGTEAESFHLVMQGVVSVQVPELGDQALKTLGAGKVVDELSYLDRRPRKFTVVAAEDAMLLALRFDDLDARVASNPIFAAAWYRSLAELMAHDLREGGGTLGHHDGLVTQTNAWQKLQEALNRLKQATARVDNEALAQGGQASNEAMDEVREAFRHLVSQTDAYMGSSAPLSEDVADALGRRLFEEMLPLVLLTRSARHVYEKPTVFAGDFETTHLIYENRPEGTGRLGPLLDECFLQLPSARAIRNRRELATQLLAAFTEEHVESGNEGPLRVLSLGCGSAEELFDAYQAIGKPEALRAWALDVDAAPVVLVAERSAREGLTEYLTSSEINLVELAVGRSHFDEDKLDLVYSLGMTSYLDDQAVVKVLNYVHGLLKPGGRLLLGAFHPRNPVRPVMEHILDWRVNHRSETRLNRLLEASHFGAQADDFCYEDENIVYFALVVKA